MSEVQTRVQDTGITGRRPRTPNARGTSWILAAIVLLLAPVLLQGSYYLYVLVLVVIYACGTQALDLVLGRLGLASLAHGALFAVGAYALGLLTTRLHWPYWGSFVAAIVITAVAGSLVGIITLRMKGHFFAIGTLAFSGFLVVVLQQWSSLTGGAIGVFGIPGPPDIHLGPITIDFTTTNGKYFLALVVLALIVAVRIQIDRSAFGAALRVIGSDEVLASSVGINVVLEKTKVFATSAAMVGAAGALYATAIAYLNPDLAGTVVGFNFLVYAILGGVGTVAGPIIGPLIVLFSTEFFGSSPVWGQLVFGVLVVLILVFFPGGIAGGITNLSPGLRTRLGRMSGNAAAAGRRGDRAGVSGADQARSAAIQSDYWRRNFGAGGATPDGTLLEVKDLTKAYGGLHAVEKVTLRADRGEIVGVIGPNGAGKSTLFGMIAGTLRATSGSVIFDGQSIERVGAFQRSRRGVGRTFQTNRVLPGRTALENLISASDYNTRTGLLRNLTAIRSRMGWKDRVADATELCNALGIGHRRDDLAQALTVEEQKLLGVGMALARRPRLLLLDEPFAGLREGETGGLESLLRALRDAGVTVLLVEHKMRVVMSLCDRCYALDRGTLIAEGRPDEVAADATVISVYLGEKHHA